jgi:hypothetical protein
MTEPENAENLNYLGSMVTYNEDVHVKFSRIAVAQATFKQKTFYQQFGLKFKEETNKVLHLEQSFVWR